MNNVSVVYCVSVNISSHVVLSQYTHSYFIIFGLTLVFPSLSSPLSLPHPLSPITPLSPSSLSSHLPFLYSNNALPPSPSLSLPLLPLPPSPPSLSSLSLYRLIVSSVNRRHVMLQVMVVSSIRMVTVPLHQQTPGSVSAADTNTIGMGRSMTIYLNCEYIV